MSLCEWTRKVCCAVWSRQPGSKGHTNHPDGVLKGPGLIRCSLGPSALFPKTDLRVHSVPRDVGLGQSRIHNDLDDRERPPRVSARQSQASASVLPLEDAQGPERPLSGPMLFHPGSPSSIAVPTWPVTRPPGARRMDGEVCPQDEGSGPVDRCVLGCPYQEPDGTARG